MRASGQSGPLVYKKKRNSLKRGRFSSLQSTHVFMEITQKQFLSAIPKHVYLLNKKLPQPLLFVSSIYPFFPQKHFLYILDIHTDKGVLYDPSPTIENDWEITKMLMTDKARWKMTDHNISSLSNRAV